MRKPKKTSKSMHKPSDFVITRESHKENITVAYRVKTTKEPHKLGILEIIEIERLYWEAQNINWKIITDNDLSNFQSLNKRL